MLISTFFAYPSFQRRFGEQHFEVPETIALVSRLMAAGIKLADGSYQLEANWQIALGRIPSLALSLSYTDFEQVWPLLLV